MAFGRKSKRPVFCARGMQTENVVALAWMGQPNIWQAPPYRQRGRSR
jgi:hypothetical protein